MRAGCDFEHIFDQTSLASCVYRAVGSFVGTANNYLCQEVYVLAQVTYKQI